MLLCCLVYYHWINVLHWPLRMKGKNIWVSESRARIRLLMIVCRLSMGNEDQVSLWTMGGNGTLAGLLAWIMVSHCVFD